MDLIPGKEMISKFKYVNWKKGEPSNLLEYLLSPTSNKIRFVNFIFQKVLRINSQVPFMVHYTSIVNGQVYLGRNVAPYFANSGHCYISGINKIFIGDDTIFAPGVKLISANHNFEDYSKHDHNVSPIIIGKSCWIGANAIILPGVELGDNVIVGAGSVVTKSFESNTIIAGNPAQIVRKRI